MFRKIVLILLVLVITLLTGCNSSTVYNSETSFNTSLNANSSVLIATARMESDILGIAFDYPESWIKELHAYPRIDFTLNSIDKASISLMNDSIPEICYDENF